MTDIDDLVRRAQAELVETPPLPRRGSQGSTVQHEVRPPADIGKLKSSKGTPL